MRSVREIFRNIFGNHEPSSFAQQLKSLKRASSVDVAIQQGEVDLRHAMAGLERQDRRDSVLRMKLQGILIR